jgi:hypothetical protein
LAGPDQERAVKQTAINILLKYVIGFGLLGLVIWWNWEPTNGTPGLRVALARPVQWGPLALAGAICTLSLLLTIVRWYWLVQAQGLPFTLSSAIRLGLVGYYYNTFLPGAVGGDLIKAAGIARAQSRRTVAVATVIMDRLIGLWALVWFVSLLGLGFWLTGQEVLLAKPNLQRIVLFAAGLLGVSVLGWLLMGLLAEPRATAWATWLERWPKVGGPAAEFWRAVWLYRRRPGAVGLAVLLSLVSHTGFVLTFFFAAQTFQPTDALSQLPTLTEHFVLVPVGLTVQALIPLPGGVGGGEYGFGKLYVLLGYPEANGILGSLSQRIISWLLGLVGYLVYLRMGVRATTAVPPTSTEPYQRPTEDQRLPAENTDRCLKA